MWSILYNAASIYKKWLVEYPNGLFNQCNFKFKIGDVFSGPYRWH